MDQQTLLWHIEFYGKKRRAIEARDVNYLGPSKFRTGAKNGKEQIYYYNRNKKNKVYNKFLAIRKETSASDIIFSVEKLIHNSNNLENIYYKIDDELKEFDNDRNKLEQPIQGISTSDIARQQRVSKS